MIHTSQSCKIAVLSILLLQSAGLLLAHTRRAAIPNDQESVTIEQREKEVINALSAIKVLESADGDESTEDESTKSGLNNTKDEEDGEETEDQA